MTETSRPTCFQEVILRLQNYWADKGCAILQPYDMEVGAGTFHPAALAGDTKAAQALIATVLQNDPTKISALKMQGAWQIEEDKVEDAIATLRTGA